jgi:hypothetical protein
VRYESRFYTIYGLLQWVNFYIYTRPLRFMVSDNGSVSETDLASISVVC